MKIFNEYQFDFGRNKLHLRYVGCDSCLLSLEIIIDDCKHLEASFDFSNSDKCHEISDYEYQKARGKLEIGTLRSSLIYEFVLRDKVFVFGNGIIYQGKEILN